MIKVKRMIVSGDKPFEDCEVYRLHEQNSFPNLFEDDQICFKDRLGVRYIISDYTITCIELNRKMAPPPNSIKARRINIASDITFSPAWILPDWRDQGIPDIFGYPFQFVFIDRDKYVYVTNDVNVVLVELF